MTLDPEWLRLSLDNSPPHTSSRVSQRIHANGPQVRGPLYLRCLQGGQAPFRHAYATERLG